VKAYYAHHARKKVEEAAYELQPTRFVDFLSGFDALGIPNFPPLSFATEIPLSEK